ncbi:MAG TPA: endonuclease III, partial [Pseudobdellovibrionaceae bacterium]|nr:endonuclease III [Pseudobdellovibrionaceae bacterium]
MTNSRDRQRQEKISKDIRALKGLYPDAHCELDFSNPFELLIATILSAQCTDQRVNMVTPELFRQFPDPKSMAGAELEVVESIIRSTGFYRNKAKSLIGASKALVQHGNGDLPRSLEELQKLPGVGRKTANVVLGNAFHIPSGIVVDTHVQRLSHRLGWTKAKGPEKIEASLLNLIAQNNWILVSHLLIWHGRRVCKARNPNCDECLLNKT